MAKNKNNSKISDSEQEGLEIISPGSPLVEANDEKDQAVQIDREKIQVKKSGNLVVGNVNLFFNPIKKRTEHYKTSAWYLVVDIFLVLLIAAFIIFLLTLNNKFGREDVSLSISQSGEHLAAGSSLSFVLNYKTNIEADNSLIKIDWPDNLEIQSIVPEQGFDPVSRTLTLGQLKKNSSGQLRINASAWGEVNERQMIAFSFFCDQCAAEGFSNYLFYNIEKPVLDLKIISDETIYSGSRFDGLLRIKNNSDQALSTATINLGREIEIKSSDLTIKDDQLIINNLAGNEIREVKFSALIKAEGDLILKPKIEALLSGRLYSFSTPDLAFQVKEPGLKLSLNSSGQAAEKNETIDYVLNYSNQEETDLEKIEISLSSANPNFSLASLKLSDHNSNLSLKNNIISINKLSSRESASVSLTAVFDERQIRANQELSLRASARYEKDDQRVEYSVFSNRNKVVSQVSIAASAYYYSPQGDQLGVGPLPPAVDMDTSYWIFLDFANSGNNLKNFSLSAELPDNVYFSDEKRVLAGRLIYGEIARRLIWEIDETEGGANKYQASFKLSLRPSENDLGQLVDLLRNIKFTVRDDFADRELSGQINNINTELVKDKLSSGRGRVIRIN